MSNKGSIREKITRKQILKKKKKRRGEKSERVRLISRFAWQLSGDAVSQAEGYGRSMGVGRVGWQREELEFSWMCLKHQSLRWRYRRGSVFRSEAWGQVK